MKLSLALILIWLVIVGVFSISTLREELSNAGKRIVFLEERNATLERELMHLSSINRENEQFLNELRRSVDNFENKLPFEALQRKLPKEIWNEIKSILGKLRFPAAPRTSNSFPEKY